MRHFVSRDTVCEAILHILAFPVDRIVVPAVIDPVVEIEAGVSARPLAVARVAGSISYHLSSPES